jgi:hypothetical protein
MTLSAKTNEAASATQQSNPADATLCESLDNERSKEVFEMADGHILLEPEQEELLCRLVEAALSVKEKRQPFIETKEARQDYLTTLLHEGLRGASTGVFMGDMEALVNARLLASSYISGNTRVFYVTPEGFRYYRELKQRLGEPVERVETETRKYLDGDRFRAAYPAAYKKWSDAEALLWDAEAKDQLTTVGHLCREAMQEFAAVLVRHYQPPNVNQDPTHTVARVRSVLKAKASQLGTTEAPFIDTLIAYWGTVSDLIQRQEHGSQREGTPLIWEDGRRSVFQTAVVMFEVDRALSRTR